MLRSDTAPRLELDWEEGLFRFVRGLVRRVAPKKGAPEHAAELASVAPRLEVLASLCAGRPLKIVAAERQGGLRGDDLLVPSHLAAFGTVEANLSLYVLRAAVSGAAARARPAVPPARDARAVDTLCVLEAAVRRLSGELPGFEAHWRSAAARLLDVRPEPSSLPRRAAILEGWRRDVLCERPLPPRDAMLRALPGGKQDGPALSLFGELLEHPGAEAAAGGDAEDPSTGKERRAPRKIEDVRRKLLEDDPEQANPVLHTFEKVETLDSHEGGLRTPDGSDELDDQLEALEEVDLREVIRGGDPAQSILRADIDIAGEIPDVERIRPDETGVPYDEWDVRRRAYRPGWCTVYPTPVRAVEPSFGRAVVEQRRREIRRLHARLEGHRSKLRDERRQLDGEEIDIDAAVDAEVDRRAGRDGPGRVYVRRTAQERDFAAAVLLDVSLSTDSWVHDRRVLDVARTATVVLGEVAHRLGDRLAVFAFASKTRNACRVFEVKGFAEPWTPARDRIGALEPQGYTRIGPAVRHAAAQLAKQDAKRRLLLVVSDGKPTDYDRYEGRYGVADIRMALREATRSGVVAHALTIDTTARSHLSATFGQGAWHVMSDPEMLPRVLTEAYGRLTAG